MTPRFPGLVWSAHELAADPHRHRRYRDADLVGDIRLHRGSRPEDRDSRYAISRLPIVPDFPPWAVTIAAAHADSIRAQTAHAPEVLAAAERYLRAHQSHVSVMAKIVEGVPKDQILRAARVLGADRIVLGSHGRGRGERAVLGSTAAAVASGAACTVHIARPRPASHAIRSN